MDAPFRHRIRVRYAEIDGQGVVFNAHWLARIPGLRPTAGYPGDSARFREAIEPACRARGLEPDSWWRVK